MSTQTPATAGKAAPVKTESKFAKLTLAQKGIFSLKVAAMLVTFGFAFPNILSGD